MSIESTLRQISLQARRLSFFAQANSAYSYDRLREIESQRAIPAVYTFSLQVQEVNQQIQSLLRENAFLPPSATALAQLSSDLNDRITLPLSLSNHAGIFQRIHQLIEEILRPQVAAPPTPEVDLPEAVRQDLVDQDTAEIVQRRDDQILRTEGVRLAFINKLIPFLRQNKPDPWNQALDCAEARLFETFPAIVEGCLMQTHLSYEDYSNSKFGTGVDEETFNNVRTLRPDQLIDALAPDLAGAEIPPLMVKLRALGLQHRSTYERLIYFGLQRETEAKRLKGLLSQTQEQLNEFIFSSAREGDLETLHFIIAFFSARMTLETLTEAEALAKSAEQAEASAYLWHFLWHSYALRRRVGDDDERPPKMLKNQNRRE